MSDECNKCNKLQISYKKVVKRQLFYEKTE